MKCFKILVLLTLAASVTGCSGKIVLGDLGMDDAATEVRNDADEEDGAPLDAGSLDQ